MAVARALVNRPALILADEPTGTLDLKTGLEIMGLFDRLNRSGITIVIVTHDQNVANFARRIITLSDGFLIEDRVQENRRVPETCSAGSRAGPQRELQDRCAAPWWRSEATPCEAY